MQVKVLLAVAALLAAPAVIAAPTSTGHQLAQRQLDVGAGVVGGVTGALDKPLEQLNNLPLDNPLAAGAKKFAEDIKKAISDRFGDDAAKTISKDELSAFLDDLKKLLDSAFGDQVGAQQFLKDFIPNLTGALSKANPAAAQRMKRAVLAGLPGGDVLGGATGALPTDAALPTGGLPAPSNLPLPADAPLPDNLDVGTLTATVADAIGKLLDAVLKLVGGVVDGVTGGDLPVRV